MRKLVRGIVIAAFAMVLAGSACSQSWNSTTYTGLTSMKSVLEGDTFVWTLTNNSSLAQDEYSDFDILIWDLMPYQILEPASWTAPEGWTWNGTKMELVSSSSGYFTPYAIGPGQSLTFTYRPKLGGEYINTSGPPDIGPLFASHVAAVVPGSGSFDGSDRWDDYFVRDMGPTWHDQAITEFGDRPLIPEPGGVLVLALGVVSLATLIMPRRRRLP
jgi:hypothetical protein